MFSSSISDTPISENFSYNESEPIDSYEILEGVGIIQEVELPKRKKKLKEKKIKKTVKEDNYIVEEEKIKFTNENDVIGIINKFIINRFKNGKTQNS